MGPKQAAGIDAWLRQGGVVVTASDRASRAITTAYHRARRSEGLTGWAAPRVLDWQSFARDAWQQRSMDGRLLLNPVQEQALWTDIVAGEGSAAVALEESRRRLAAMAMEAHALICSYAPQLLDGRARSGWQQDAAAFSRWLAAFDDACRSSNALSTNRVPLELIPLLREEPAGRPPILLAGFDRLLPVEQTLFEAWGEWSLAADDSQPAAITHYEVPDEHSELAACAAWCRRKLQQNPDARLLILTQDAAKRRGEIERALLGSNGDDGPLRFEFSLGVPLNGVSVARSASMLLRWLDGSLREHEVDWLIASGHSARSQDETSALHAYMRKLRDRGLQRVQWTLRAFLLQPYARLLPQEWTRRMAAAQRQLQTAAQHPLSPLDCADLVPELLRTIGWPGDRSASSIEFQAARRFQQAVDACGSLGFRGVRITWHEFIAELDHAIAETLFAPESEDAPIVIAGPAESAGLHADAIWFLGATEDAWPAPGSLHPLLPAEVQRATSMPHAAAQLDWDVAQAVTARVLRSAPEACFSHARLTEGVETRASRLVLDIAGAPQPLPPDWNQIHRISPATELVRDVLSIPLSSGHTDIRGGSSVLTAQSQCAFKAFATARLSAQGWTRAEAALTPAIRGNLVHSVLHAIWAGPPDGIRTLDELLAIPDRRAFVAAHAERVMTNDLPPDVREQMPQRYLGLEQERLTRLITDWLNYEAARLPFMVAGTEMKSAKEIAGLMLNMRLDRIDRLNDGSYLVIDYKTGDVSQKLWDLPRPDDVQLPLYAGFALEPGQDLGGLVFAKVRAGDLCFTGRVGDAPSTLGGVLKNITSLKRTALTLEQLLAWRDAIERLARDFLDGRADVDPRDPPQTCARCGLYTLCRIQERELVTEEAMEGADE